MNAKLFGPLGAVLLLAASAPMAHASLQITYSIDGGATVTCGPVANPNPAVQCPNINGPAFKITFLGATSDAPGGAALSQEESAAVDISNVDPNASHSIVINIVSTGFTQPVTPPAITLLSHIGGTVVTANAANTLSYQSCIDTTNNLNGGCPATINSGISTPVINAVGSFNDDQTGLINSLAGPYAVDEVLSITLGVGSNINFSASTTLQATPEPMSIVLLGGVVLFTSGMIRRKQKKATEV